MAELARAHLPLPCALLVGDETYSAKGLQPGLDRNACHYDYAAMASTHFIGSWRLPISRIASFAQDVMIAW
jgi:hypothetical protein